MTLSLLFKDEDVDTAYEQHTCAGCEGMASNQIQAGLVLYESRFLLMDGA
jgi:hypothetical protein